MKLNLIKATKDINIFKSLDKEESNENKFKIFNEHIDVPFVYQNNVYNNNESLIFNNFANLEVDNMNKDDIILLTEVIYKKYKLYERSLVEYKNSYKFYGYMLYNWVNGKPLKYIIKNTIYGIEKEYIPFLLDLEYSNKRKYYNIYKGSDKQINLIINNVLESIENIIKHLFKKYFSNFIKLNILNGNLDESFNKLIDYIEFGTKNYKIIELQKYGFSRELAHYLLDNHKCNFEFKNKELVNINFKNIFIKFNKEDPLYEEFKDYSYILY